jgi:hypothetical protein
MTEFKLKFLACSWEDELIQDQICFQSMTPFLTWINKVQNANDKLHAAGSTYYIPPANLRKHLVPHLAPALKRLYNGNNGIPLGATVGMLDAITALEEWQERVWLLEQDLDVCCSQWVTKAKKTKTVTVGGAPTTAPTVPGTSTYNTTPIPRLTDEEKALLSLHLGCFKCRTFYAGHISPNCKISRCMLEACRNITPENAAKAKAAFKKSQVTTHIAAVFEDSDNEDYFDDCEDQHEGDEYMPHPLSFPEHL